MQSSISIAGLTAIICHDELPLTGEPLPADVVPGPVGASLTLLGITPRTPVDSVWDLGCGSGVHAVFAAQHAGRVIATDIDEKALALTQESAAASGVRVETRAGSLFEPVKGERFDLIISNPPFVIGQVTTLTHRESPFPADELARELISGLPDFLTQTGRAVLVLSWLETSESDWQSRIQEWLPEGLSAWVGLRELVDLDTYIKVWLADAGQEGQTDLALEWKEKLLGWDATAIAFGAVVLQPTAAEPEITFDDLRSCPRWPTADELFDRINTAKRAQSLNAVELLATSFAKTESQPWRGQITVEPWLLSLRDKCDGITPLHQLVSQLADEWKVEESDLTILALAGAKTLVDWGLIG